MCCVARIRVVMIAPLVLRMLPGLGVNADEHGIHHLKCPYHARASQMLNQQNHQQPGFWVSSHIRMSPVSSVREGIHERLFGQHSAHWNNWIRYTTGALPSQGTWISSSKATVDLQPLQFGGPQDMDVIWMFPIAISTFSWSEGIAMRGLPTTIRSLGYVKIRTLRKSPEQSGTLIWARNLWILVTLRLGQIRKLPSIWAATQLSVVAWGRGRWHRLPKLRLQSTKSRDEIKVSQEKL